MIETDQQRRWWFATHPEFRSSRRGGKSRKHEDNEGEQRVYSREQIDAYVAEGLKYFPTGPVAAMLRALKWGLGTNHGPTPLDFLLKGTLPDQPESEPSDKSENDKEDEKEREPTFLDSVLKALHQSLDAEPWWDPIFIVNSSRTLRRSMIEARRGIPEGWSAHHIVPKYDGRFGEAIEARKILEKFGIELDSSPNGVALPYKTRIPEYGYHPKIHTQTYYAEVLRLLRGAATKEKAIQALKDIGEKVLRGTFPK